MGTTMNSIQGLRQAILDNPHDDQLRLVYADHLEESGNLALARFIRLQMDMQRVRESCGCGSCVREIHGGGQHHNGPCALDNRDYRSQRKEEVELLNVHHQEWLTGLPSTRPFVHGRSMTISVGLADNSDFPSMHYYFRKGMVHTVATYLMDWWRHGPQMVWTMPIVQVRFENRHPANVQGKHRRRVYCWFAESQDRWIGNPAVSYSIDQQSVLPAEWFPKGKRRMNFDYPREAYEWLSEAALNWARNT